MRIHLIQPHGGVNAGDVHSCPQSNNWGNDRLGSGILNVGREKLYRFAKKASCKQDLQWGVLIGVKLAKSR